MKKKDIMSARRWFWFNLVLTILYYIDLGIFYVEGKWFWFLIYLLFGFSFTLITMFFWSIGFGGRR
jgi:hypothetical protein